MLSYVWERVRGILFSPVKISPPPQNVVVDRDVEIATRDGTLLRANVYRPQAPGRYPVILSYHPYGKDHLPRPGWPLIMFRLLRQSAPIHLSAWTGWEAPDPAYWAGRGYVVINCDMRGFYRSGGQAVLLSAQEGLDYYDLIEWAAVQPWSTGKVGLSGVSYLCLTQWRAAALNPPSLAAICAWEGFTSVYHDLAYPGGIREDGFVPFWFGKLDKRRVVENLRTVQMENPLYNDKWKNLEPALEDIRVPALICASFSDHNLHSRGSFEAFRRIASQYKWLYTHRTGKWAAYYSPEGLAWQTRFFDCFLKGEENGMKEVPPVRLEIRETGNQVLAVREEKEWPLARSQPQVLAMGSGMCHFPSGVLSLEHRFDRDTEITGPMTLNLHVETSTTLCLFAGVRKLSAGREVVFEGSYGFGRDLVTRGFLKVNSGQVSLELLPSSTFFRRGDTLRLDLQGRYFFPRHPLLGQFPAGYEASPQGTLTVHKSELIVPIIPLTSQSRGGQLLEGPSCLPRSILAMRSGFLLLLWLVGCLPAMAQLTVARRERQGVTILDLSGPLTQSTVEQFQASVEAARLQGSRRITLNFAAATSLDSQGQRALIQVFAASSQAGVRLVWCRLRPNHREALLTTHLLGVVPFYVSEDEAVASF